jgi:glycosyltransferase involved in cell wall biosynthesis
LAEGLVGDGVSVTVLCRDHDHEFGNDAEERRQLLGRLGDRGVDVVVLPGRTSSPRALGELAFVWRHTRRTGPDVVHAQYNYEPRLLALALGLPSVLTVHDPVPHPGQPKLGRSQQVVADAWLRRASRVVVHGEALKDALPSSTASRAVVIPHGLVPERAPLPTPETPTVLLWGRLEPYKGVEILLEAMPAIWAQRPDVKLVVAGTGPSARAVPRDPRIERHLEYVPEAKLHALLARASLVVLPYTEASQSGVGSLAVAAGVPVIVSDVGALPDLSLDPSYVVPAGESGALASAIVSHLDDGDDVRHQIHERAVTQLSWSAVARRHRAVYEAVLDPQPEAAPTSVARSAKHPR